MEIKAITGAIARVRTGALIVTHYEGKRLPEGDTAVLDKALGGAITRLIKQGEIKGKAGEITLLHSPAGITASRVVVVGLGKKRGLTTDKIRAAVAEALRYVRGRGITSAATVVPGDGVRGIKTEAAAQAVAEGAILGLYTFHRHMSKKGDNNKEIKTLKVIGKGRAQLAAAIALGQVLAEAAIRARDMVNEPANFMTPTVMAETAQKLADEYGLSVEIFDRDKMTELGMGGLLGVSQGSQQPPRFIILKYRGRSGDQTDLALVGKGLTFDSGGISIKPSERMGEMKGDMAGGAAVMAAMASIARLKPAVNVTALVPATENMPSGSALKPGDIITALSGKTIEVLNTDAEGRLVLADALSYAKNIGAKAIIDAATLTGACQVALGNMCSGAFTNNPALQDKVVAAAKTTGELVWPLPMYEEYAELIKSDVADIKNIGNRYGGAITAAKFLEEFVGGVPWVHLDIAGTFLADKDKGYLLKGGTGVPARTLVTLVLQMAK